MDRYETFGATHNPIRLDDEGSLVLYDDHAAALAEKDEAIERERDVQLAEHTRHLDTLRERDEARAEVAERCDTLTTALRGCVEALGELLDAAWDGDVTMSAPRMSDAMRASKALTAAKRALGDGA